MVGRDLTSCWWFFSTRQQPRRSLNCSTFIWLSCNKLFCTGSSLGSAFTTILACFCIFLLYFGSSVMVSEVYSCCVWFLAHHSLSCCLPQCVWLFEGWTINSISVSCLLFCMRLPAQPRYILASSVSFLLPLFHIFLLFWHSFSSLLEFPSPGTLKASPR